MLIYISLFTKPCEKDRLWRFLLSHFLSAFTFS